MLTAIFSLILSILLLSIIESIFSKSSGKFRTNGKAQAGLIGMITGKVGNLIFQRFKGIQVVKTYVIPSNPNSPNQITVRTGVFSNAVKYCQSLLCFWNTYWNASMFSDKTFPYASAMKRNLRNIYETQQSPGPKTFLPATLTLGSGGVNVLPSLTTTQAAADVVIGWDSSLMTFEDFCDCYDSESFTLHVVIVAYISETIELVMKFDEEFDQTLYESDELTLTGVATALSDQFGVSGAGVVYRSLITLTAHRPDDAIVWHLADTQNQLLEIT